VFDLKRHGQLWKKNIGQSGAGWTLGWPLGWPYNPKAAANVVVDNAGHHNSIEFVWVCVFEFCYCCVAWLVATEKEDDD